MAHSNQQAQSSGTNVVYIHICRQTLLHTQSKY